MDNNTQVLEGNDLDKWFNGEETTKVEEIKPADTIDDFFDPPAPKEPEEKKVEEPEPPKVESTQPFYATLLKEYIEDGEFEDAYIDIENESGEVNQVLLSELTDVSAETFKQIREAQKNLKEEKFKASYVSTEGLDPTTLKLIELKKSGGDISELIKIEAQHVNPIKNLDLDNEAIQEGLVRQKLQFQGIDPDIIELTIKKHKENLTLDKAAGQVAQEINTNYEKTVEKQLQEQQALATQIQEEQKVFKKSMTETFRGFELKDSLVKNLVDQTSKYDENGLTESDKMYFSLRETNPKLFAEVVFHMSNPEAFNEFKGVKIKNENAKATVKSILTLTPKSASAPVTVKSIDKVDEFFNTK